MDLSMASLYRIMFRLFCLPGILTFLHAETPLFFTDDPEYITMNLDSVVSGTIRYQVRSGSDYIYSHRSDISLTPAFSFRTYGKAGTDKTQYGTSCHFTQSGVSLSLGPVLMSHAMGWVVGKASPRRSLYPGNIRFAQVASSRKGPFTYSDFKGCGSYTLRSWSISAFSSDDGAGYSLGFEKSGCYALTLYHTPDHWKEAWVQVRKAEMIFRLNSSFHPKIQQCGHISGDLTIRNSGGRIQFMAYTTSDRFKPALGKHPWFGGEKNGCTGVGWGIFTKPNTQCSLRASLIQQKRADGYDRKAEGLISTGIGNMKSKTLFRLNTKHTVRADTDPPFLLIKDKNHVFTCKQSFLFPVNPFLDLQSVWLMATDYRSPTSAGLFLITVHNHSATIKIQISQVMGGSADLWYTRLFAGNRVIIQKAGNCSLTALDVTGLLQFKHLQSGLGFSWSEKESRGVLQLQIALDSVNR